MNTKEVLERLKEFCEKRLAIIEAKESGGDVYTWSISGSDNPASIFIDFDELSDDEKEIIAFLSDSSMGKWVYGKQVVLQEKFINKDMLDPKDY